jgi:hypothetical protein
MEVKLKVESFLVRENSITVLKEVKELNDASPI